VNKVENRKKMGLSKHNFEMISKTLMFFMLLVISFLVLVPFLWMLSSSLKLDNEVFSVPIQWIPKSPRWANYLDIWKQVPFLTFYKNTAKLTLIITLLQLFTSSLASYGFAKMKFPGRNTLFIAYIATIAVPWQVYMVPQFILMKKVGLVDTHMSLILLQAFTAFGVFLLRQFYMSIPEELSEAARIDGLSEYGIYARIILPLSKPSLATLTIFTFVNTWNDFMGPLIYLNSTKLKTIQLGLRMFISQYAADYGLIMAASVVAVVPVVILFIFTQRFFIEGIATTGLKG
jgi:multiple sugar transport system permease protein